MKTLRFAAVPVALVIALSACDSGGDVTQPTNSSSSSTSSTTENGGGSTTSSGGDTTTTTTTSTTTDTSTTSGSGGGDTGSSGTMKAFGETAKWPSGLEVTPAKPVQFTPRDGALGSEGYKYAVKINFTVKNTGSSPMKPFLYPKGQSGTREMKDVYDSTNGCGSIPSSSILPGKTLTFTRCMALDDVNDITISLQPDYKDDEVFWVTKKS